MGHLCAYNISISPEHGHGHGPCMSYIKMGQRVERYTLGKTQGDGTIFLLVSFQDCSHITE